MRCACCWVLSIVALSGTLPLLGYGKLAYRLAVSGPESLCCDFVRDMSILYGMSDDEAVANEEGEEGQFGADEDEESPSTYSKSKRGAFNMLAAATKEDNELEALLAEIEKPVEKVAKGKKKGGAASNLQPSATEKSAASNLQPSAIEKSATSNLQVSATEKTEAESEVKLDETGDSAQPVAGDAAAKKKDKKKKKKAEKDKKLELESTPEGDSVAASGAENQEGAEKKEEDSSVDKKKKKETPKETRKKKHVSMIKELLRKRQEEEERLLREQKEEEERLLAIQKAKEEQERLAREKKEREKQRKKERDERLKAEGKYLTPAQKEKLRRQQALLANSNIILPIALRREGEEEAPTKRPVYGKRKPKKGPKPEEKVSAPESVQPAQEPEIKPAAKPAEEISTAPKILDSWDDEIVDDWESLNVEEDTKEVAQSALEQAKQLAPAVPTAAELAAVPAPGEHLAAASARNEVCFYVGVFTAVREPEFFSLVWNYCGRSEEEKEHESVFGLFF
ncbi:unnamed protein product [Gongylonema pulchrum]|uniref:Eukaryotic translation initiation factor 5B n=1 Tax=Gongylonema pulchrum TaxID=637853 RepID=A0A183DX90_9BILA|nr:unnamed protein product [Gongylonema pulchrum]